MKKFLLFILILFTVHVVVAQEESAVVRQGNKLYKTNKYTEAEIAYRKGLEINPSSFEANYNLGNALYKQGKYNDALEQYKNSAALQTVDKMKLASAYHNTGNALLSEKKIEESINAYKLALKSNPNDIDTKYNLAFAQELLKRQKQQQQNKDQNKKDQNKDNKNDKNKDKQQQEQQQKQQQQQQQMSKENAQQILDALMQDEKNTLDKTKKAKVRSRKSAEKDW